MTAAESRELVDLAGGSGKVAAVNFNIRFYPLNQHLRGFVADGGLGDVRLISGRYFQDWLLMETDWNWRLEPDRGGALRAVGDIGSHWLDLTSFVTGLHVAEVMADLATFIPLRQQPSGPVETFSRERAAETVKRDIQTEDVATILLRYDGGARGVMAVSQISPGPQELAPIRDRRLERRRRVGFGVARRDVDRPARQAERDAGARRGADE